MEGILRPLGKKRFHGLNTCCGGISLIGPAYLPQCLFVREQSCATAIKGMPRLYECSETPFPVLPSCLIHFGGPGEAQAGMEVGSFQIGSFVARWVLDGSPLPMLLAGWVKNEPRWTAFLLDSSSQL